jgi:hypothetical protein
MVCGLPGVPGCAPTPTASGWFSFLGWWTVRAGHGRDDEPGGIYPEMTGWEMGEGAGVQVGDDLLHDGVVAVLAIGLDQPSATPPDDASSLAR